MRFFAGLFLTAVCAYGSGSFTLEQILSAPFPTDMTVSRNGKLAWVQNSEGRRNIWVAGAPEYKGRQITNYTEDDGQEISDLSISSEGTMVVYTRGEGPNPRGEFPNPRHVVTGVEQAVFVAPFTGGEPREIGKGSLPAISRDGKTVAFVLSGQVWSAPLDGSAKAAQLIHARGAAESLDWSPDGRYLALASSRLQHSFIAVYSTTERTIRFLDPSVDLDSSPAWSPDSKQIAFIRQPTTQEAFMFGPKRSAQTPWSICVAEAATGKGREVWKAQPGPGSVFREVSGEHQLLWAAGNRLIFPWERSGYTHLHSTSVLDGGASDLTPGEFEVEHVALSPDATTILYSSNQDDVDRRHLWRVAVTGGTPRRLTTGAELEWEPAMTGEDIAFFRSTPSQPAHASILTKDGIKDLDSKWLPESFPIHDLVEPQSVLFAAADGLEIHGQIFLPRDGKAKHPAVIFFHGGSRRQMLLGWHYMYYYSNAYALNQYLASRGYVVLAVNYRSGIGYGLDFREALNYGATGASEFNDVIGAGFYIRSREDVMPNRIGLWGGSYGGYLTALGLARASDLFAAGVDMHGVHEWNDEIENFVPLYKPAEHEDVARVAFQSSPMAFVSTWKSPVLLVHGDDDRNVNFKQTMLLAEALRKQDVAFEQLIFPDEIHDFLLHEHWLAAYHAADAFLGRYLQRAMPQ